MKKLVVMALALALSGCISINDTVDSGSNQIQGGACDIQYPDGSAADCIQHATMLGEETAVLGYLCTDQSVPGPQGSVRILREVGSGTVAISLDLPDEGTSGVVWVESDPVRLWAWQGAFGDETWHLGPVQDGESIVVRVYKFPLQDLNTPDVPVSMEQLWAPVEGQAWPVHRITAGDDEYFVSRMIAVDYDDHVSYTMVSFDLDIDGHAFEARLENLISASLIVDGIPSC